MEGTGVGGEGNTSQHGHGEEARRKTETGRAWGVREPTAIATHPHCHSRQGLFTLGASAVRRASLESDRDWRPWQRRGKS